MEEEQPFHKLAVFFPISQFSLNLLKYEHWSQVPTA